MTFKLTFTTLVLSLCSVLTSFSQEEAEDNLGALLKSTGWDVLIGTWLNPAGEEFIFSWRHPDTVLEMKAEVDGVKRTSIYVKRPKSHGVNAFAYNSNSGSSFGACVFSKGIAKFVMKAYTESGEIAEMRFQYTLTGENTFEVKMEGSEHIYKYTRK